MSALHRRLTFPSLALATCLLFFHVPVARAAPSCFSRRATIVGTGGDDRLIGTRGSDVIVGRSGNDLIRGRGGNDRICGNGGTDFLRGGAGRDRIRAGRTPEGDSDGGPGTDSCVNAETTHRCE